MIIALNNKSNLTKEEFLTYQINLQKIKSNNKMILCPNFLNIGSFNLKDCDLGAQNVSATGNGAFTGEISAEQLKSYNVKYVIIGHSERRKNQNESLEDINHKIKIALENNIIPILCIGETQEEREQNKVKEILSREIETACKELNEEEKSKIIVAYEPIWSIGTGIIPTNQEIEEVFNLIKTFLPQNKILYGGSANENNINILKKCQIIDGFLLGGISLKPNKLQEFVQKLDG